MNQSSEYMPEPIASQSPGSDEAFNQDKTKKMTIPVIEEQVQVAKKVVESGTVRITKVVTEQEVPVDIPLMEEQHDIRRIPVNQYVETLPPPMRYDGETMIIPVVREVLVVEKRLLLVEEVHITKTQVAKNETQHITLRKEEVQVTRADAGPDNDQAV
jgi:uncharacterized protein (TIGR02271 family)